MFAPRSRNSLGLLCAVLVLGTGAPGEGSRIEADELEGRAPTAQELQPSVEAALRRESYAPGQAAALAFFNSARGVTMQVFQSGPEQAGPFGRNEMRGVPVSGPRRVGAVWRGRRAWLPIGNWPSGLYFVRLHSQDGRVGYAPFVVRPRRLGVNRVAVVIPTMTWEAYKAKEREFYLSLPAEKVDQKTFVEMLEVLPPKNWRNEGDFVSFLMIEHWSGPYTSQYARRGKGEDATYWQKLVDSTDRSTWMKRER